MEDTYTTLTKNAHAVLVQDGMTQEDATAFMALLTEHAQVMNRTESPDPWKERFDTWVTGRPLEEKLHHIVEMQERVLSLLSVVMKNDAGAHP